ncbi:heat shock 70 kDa protein 12B-like [Ruditapes philippinarum]|uniref:heat shock 70 kDa protein 12B-like n=1 Tax=Ruditapes philippinarum TaxID=129788 RepID=UPI00295B9B9F|nr:heat shock 70 kDa protein 12B-like [Ruditapes philippinarum]
MATWWEQTNYTGTSSINKDAPRLLVVAFDFGTTYSGYAFSFRDDPLRIQSNQGWIAGSDQLISLKTPTCVLLNQRQEFDSFGFEAENKFADLAEDNKHHGWLLFRRFKMILHNNENLSRSTTVEDINGKSMPALTVFTMAIRYLKDHFLEALNKQKTGIEDKDIQYVITVPALWNDKAKQFMREAAEKAGIAKTQLKLSFEPEAASIWCQTISTDIKESLTRSGKQYMVIDLGGGTADISVHEKQIDDTLKELHKASGGPWGGTIVDDNFIEWVTKIIGKSTMQRFKDEQMEDYFQLLREFEIKKRNIKTDSTGNITFRLPASLKYLYRKDNRDTLKDRIVAMGLSDVVKYNGDKLRVDASVIKQWFEPPIYNVIQHVQQILSKPNMQKVETIILVGGFGECKYAQDILKKAMHDRKIFIPEEPGLVVLKGAVRFGHFQEIVRSRIMTHTYGIGVVGEYDEQEYQNAGEVSFHRDRNFVDIVVFDIIIRAGDETSIGKVITKGPYVPSALHTTHFVIYTTETFDPKFVTDQGCKQIGMLTVSHANGRCQDDNPLMASFIFGDTELYVKAVNIRTKEEFSTYIDCL